MDFCPLLSTALDRDRSPVCARSGADKPARRRVRQANLLDGFRQGKHPTARAECRENRDFSPFHGPENDRGFRFREDG
jgi:hypothetical protein